ncbi:MAG: DUF1727 domain-containing protein, partial [Chloroflexi bacterium]
PEIVPGLASALGQGSALVTGTNGKTTTARLLRNMARAGGLQTVANRAGSNMMRGIAAALVESSGWNGELAVNANTLGVFEVDEATAPQAAWALRPRAVLFTNLFRDQLDRYGEVEYVASVWRKAVASWPDLVTLVLNADDPAVASLGESAKGPVLYYGLEDTSAAVGALEHAADARWCSRCGAELVYADVFYGHLGHWRCEKCKLARPAVQASCTRVMQDPERLVLTINLPKGRTVSASLPLTGLYNAYNALAAAATANVLGLETQAIEEGLATSTAAFGRQERLTVGGRKVQVMLAKNPAGLNQVIRTITGNGGSALRLAIFLNDGIADGRDISWIWDVDFELLQGKTGSVIVSGTRAWDMALRLKYAGLEPQTTVEPDGAQALRQALRATPEGETLYVIPTYTAMLVVRDLLARWGGRSAFWEEE